MGRGLVTILAAAVVWHAASEPLGLSLGGAAPWVAAIASGLLVLGAFLLVVHGIVGVSARNIVERAEERLKSIFERVVRRYVLGEGDNGLGKGPLEGPTDL